MCLKTNSVENGCLAFPEYLVLSNISNLALRNRVPKMLNTSKMVRQLWSDKDLPCPKLRLAADQHPMD